MNLFPFTKDLQAFLLRVTASLERIDGAVSEAQLMIRNANQGVTELRETVAGIRSGMAVGPRKD